MPHIKVRPWQYRYTRWKENVRLELGFGMTTSHRESSTRGGRVYRPKHEAEALRLISGMPRVRGYNPAGYFGPQMLSGFGNDRIGVSYGGQYAPSGGERSLCFTLMQCIELGEPISGSEQVLRTNKYL